MEILAFSERMQVGREFVRLHLAVSFVLLCSLFFFFLLSSFFLASGVNDVHAF